MFCTCSVGDEQDQRDVDHWKANMQRRRPMKIPVTSNLVLLLMDLIRIEYRCSFTSEAGDKSSGFSSYSGAFQPSRALHIHDGK